VFLVDAAIMIESIWTSPEVIKLSDKNNEHTEFIFFLSYTHIFKCSVLHYTFPSGNKKLQHLDCSVLDSRLGGKAYDLDKSEIF